MRDLSQQFPQTSARFGHEKIRDKKTSKLQRNWKDHHAQSGGGKWVKSILHNWWKTQALGFHQETTKESRQ